MPSIPRPSRQTLTKSAGFVGGMYLAHTYIRDRLEDVKQKMEVEVQAKENLKRRFHQTHDTTAYTVLALLPTLSSQILKEMNVEELTRELQARSSSAKRGASAAPPAPGLALAPAPAASTIPATTPAPQPGHPNQTQTALPLTFPSPASPSLASSIEIVAQPSGQSTSTSGEDPSSPPNSSLTSSSFSLTSPPGTEDMSASIQSFSSDLLDSTGSGGSSSRDSASASGEAPVPPPARAVSGLQAPVALTDSLLSSTTSLTSSSSSDIRTKAELWNEVKMLTLTRTLTTLYTSTLLSLLTTLQLTLLARSKYLSSIHDEAHAESLREKLEDGMPSLAGMVVKSLVGSVVGGVGKRFGFDWGFGFGGNGGTGGGEENDVFAGPGSGLDAFLAQLEAQVQNPSPSKAEEDDDDEEEGEWEEWDGRITEETENKYLTMSWWLLHVGWKDVGERVRRGVEEVFDGVSLKTKLSLMDLHRLVSDVRRRVEHEVTFEGLEKRTNFLSSLLPSTPETIHHALVQGGFIPPLPPSSTSNSHSTTSNLVASYHLNPESPHEQPVYPNANANGSSRHATNDSSEHDEETTTTLESSQLSEGNSLYWTTPPAPRGPPAPVGGLTLDDDMRKQQRNRDPSVSSSSLSSSSSPRHASAPLNNNTKPGSSSSATTTSNPYPHISSDPQFLSLLQETKEIVESADFARVLEGCLDRGVECLVKGLEKNVFVDSGVKREAGSAEEVLRIRLAGVFPGLARWSQLALAGVPSELVDNILDVREVQCLSAIVFGRFEDKVASAGV